MLRTRLLSGAVFLALSLWLIGEGGLLFGLGVTIAIALCGIEFTALMQNGGIPLRFPLVIGGIVALCAVQALFLMDRALTPTILGIMLVNLAVMIAAFHADVNIAYAFGLSVAITLYLGLTGVHIIALRQLPDGTAWTLLTLISTGLGDVGAYFTGRVLGRRKLAPSLSPNKTFEGYIGGVITAGVTGALIAAAFPAVIRLSDGAILGTLVGIFSPFGDLGMSAFKRAVGVKDFSKLLPGHGGILDRFDSLLIGAVIGFYYIQWIVGFGIG